MHRLLQTVSFFALAVTLLANKAESPTGNRTTPPTISAVAPLGIARGTAVEMTVEGFNLAKASAIYFSKPGITGRILRVKELPDLPDVRLGANGGVSTVDLGPLPPRNQVTVEVDASPEANIGAVGFRLQTPLGTSPEASVLIEPYYGETGDREPNNDPENATEAFLPTVLTGTISKSGDVDYFKIDVKAGEQLVFDNGAMLIGSTLQPVVSIYDADQNLIHEYGADGAMDAQIFAQSFPKAGTYYIRIADFLESGKSTNFYRIMVGQFPLVAWAYPLGLQEGKTREISLTGFDLGTTKLAVKGTASPGEEDAVLLRPKTQRGVSFNEVKLAVGPEPEVDSTGTNRSVAAAQPVSAPVTINGRIDAPAKDGTPVENYYRFHAAKGQKLVMEVNARRLGSDLDSVVDVLDAKGNQIERATVRAVLETSTTLSERDSASRGIRLLSWSGMNVGDYLMAGGEIIRIEALPNGPDSDVFFDSFGGQRLAYFDTTTEAHAVDKPVYKVQIYPPGKKFAPNGLPLVHLYYRNDDGGPGYGKDSLVHFTAPADGDYLVRIRDVRGLGGPTYAYRLTVREPRPDFRLSVMPKNPNVPLAGCIPVTVTAFRMDDFDGPIQVSLQDLPPGLHANTGTIAPGQVSTTLLLSADANAKLDRAAPLKVEGNAKAGSRVLAHAADPDDALKLIALMPKPDVIVTAETKEVDLEPGGKAQVSVSIQRENGFAGRVPLEVRNLPPRVKVPDVGLNGVLITEDQTHRTFTIEALPQAEPIEQLIYIGGAVETRSKQQNVYEAPQAILLKVKPKNVVAKVTHP